MAYDFTTLSPDDFEAMVADLLSREWGGRLESFKPGKDGGIDLRNTRVNASGTIVQCKRYAPHKINELLRSMASESNKLRKLRPSRYVWRHRSIFRPATRGSRQLSCAVVQEHRRHLRRKRVEWTVARPSRSRARALQAVDFQYGDRPGAYCTPAFSTSRTRRSKERKNR
ncbi:MAG: restriction endonuclease [Bryobacterales bacterium]|nr:restriction endonuclease [Bryobacterales bacterium]